MSGGGMAGVPGGPLAGRVGIVTGAGKGLGKAFAVDLAAAGAAVVVNNRNRTLHADGRGPADHVVDEIVAAGGRAVADTHDVVDPAAPAALIAAALDSFGRLDFVVTAAGVAPREMFHKSTPQRFADVLAINLAGSVDLAMAAAPLFREQGGGRIVFVSSSAGLHGQVGSTAYTASKGALIALTKALAAEGAAKNVFTNVLLPYAVTQMTEDMPTPWQSLMTATAVAPVVTALVDARCALNGQTITAAGGAVRLATAVEYDTVVIDGMRNGDLAGGGLSPAQLEAALAASAAGAARDYPDGAFSAFVALAEQVARS